MSKAIETTPLEIIRALRCAATPNGDCIGEACPFYVEEIVPEEMIAEVGRVKWPGCDVDAINMAAAALIEQAMQSADVPQEPVVFARIFDGPVYIEFKGQEALYVGLFDPQDDTYAGMSMYKQFGVQTRTYVENARYGGYWRCWVMAPTAQEREAAPWEDET